MINVGIDWAEDSHQVCILDTDGNTLEEFAIRDGAAGPGQLHECIANHIDEPDQVVIGMETDRGLLVGALVAADTELLAAIKVTARTHQNLIWTRTRHTNQLRSTLREFYPAALEAFEELAHRDALAILAIAPTPEQGRRLSTAKIRAALKRAGRQRNLDLRAGQIRDALRGEQFEAPPQLTAAFGDTVAALVPLLITLNEQIARVCWRSQLAGSMLAGVTTVVLLK